jgi:hypothetical protein
MTKLIVAFFNFANAPKTSQYTEIIAVCSEIHTKHINTLCGQNVEFVDVTPGGTYSNRWAINIYDFSFSRMVFYHCVVL